MCTCLARASLATEAVPAADGVGRRPLNVRRAGCVAQSHVAHHRRPLLVSTPQTACRILRGLPSVRRVQSAYAVPRHVCFSGAAIKQTTVGDAAEKLETGWTYLDVRTVEEFEEQRVPGAINVPVFVRGPGGMEPNPNFATAALEAIPKTASQVLVGCKSGQRSQAAIQQLSSVGCDFEMENVDGGIMAWAQAQLPLESK
eukprot:CAMPEP_0177768828 /NCGR_PEP_ID=MMETSP0491_2-20121128/9949_1 /TAXON_ID=63592 /ORGANISM="Tetraselmis chuii, Strain PLY429" /LENGTH=199 /DNA_ID=CAMNT_0019285701 /DNA_START=98 /DNA_END=697 /DNA_ORIENTATION=+